MVRDKTTIDMGSKKIANLINESLKKNKIMDSKGKILSINFKTICRYLNELLGTPRKIRKCIFLTEKKKEQRVKFCKNILSRGLSFKDFMFTDETKIDLGSYSNDHLRLSPKTREKLKKGKEDTYNLINGLLKKFVKSIMVASFE